MYIQRRQYTRYTVRTRFKYSSLTNLLLPHLALAVRFQQGLPLRKGPHLHWTRTFFWTHFIAEMFVGTEGFRVGLMVGFFVGFMVGFFVGFMVGFFVGFIVGFMVGFLVGFIVGFMVGFLVGFIVGAFVGFMVGGFVGALVV